MPGTITSSRSASTASHVSGAAGGCAGSRARTSPGSTSGATGQLLEPSTWSAIQSISSWPWRRNSSGVIGPGSLRPAWRTLRTIRQAMKARATTRRPKIGGLPPAAAALAAAIGLRERADAVVEIAVGDERCRRPSSPSTGPTSHCRCRDVSAAAEDSADAVSGAGWPVPTCRRHGPWSARGLGASTCAVHACRRRPPMRRASSHRIAIGDLLRRRRVATPDRAGQPIQPRWPRRRQNGGAAGRRHLTRALLTHWRRMALMQSLSSAIIAGRGSRRCGTTRHRAPRVRGSRRDGCGALTASVTRDERGVADGASRTASHPRGHRAGFYQRCLRSVP